jgi:hypothetical protein
MVYIKVEPAFANLSGTAVRYTLKVSPASVFFLPVIQK